MGKKARGGYEVLRNTSSGGHCCISIDDASSEEDAVDVVQLPLVQELLKEIEG